MLQDTDETKVSTSSCEASRNEARTRKRGTSKCSVLFPLFDVAISPQSDGAKLLRSKSKETSNLDFRLAFAAPFPKIG